MDIKKALFGSVAGLAGLFGTGYLIYIVIFSPLQYATDAAAEVSRNFFPGIIVFELLYGFLLTIIFDKWGGIKTFSDGAKAGAQIGLILGLCTSLWIYSTTTLYEANVVWWYAVTFAIRFAIAGGLVAMVLGRE